MKLFFFPHFAYMCIQRTIIIFKYDIIKHVHVFLGNNEQMAIDLAQNRV